MISKTSISIDSNAEFRSLLPQNSFRSFCLPSNNTKASSSVCKFNSFKGIILYLHIIVHALFIFYHSYAFPFTRQHFVFIYTYHIMHSFSHMSHLFIPLVTLYITFPCIFKSTFFLKCKYYFITFHLICPVSYSYSLYSHHIHTAYISHMTYHTTFHISLFHFISHFLHHFIFLVILIQVPYNTYHIIILLFVFHYTFLDISISYHISFHTFHIHILSFHNHIFHFISHFFSYISHSHMTYHIVILQSHFSFHFSFLDIFISSFSNTHTLISYHIHSFHFSFTCMFVHIHFISFQYSHSFSMGNFLCHAHKASSSSTKSCHNFHIFIPFSGTPFIITQLLLSIYTQELQSKNCTLLCNSCLLRTKEGFYH